MYRHKHGAAILLHISHTAMAQGSCSVGTADAADTRCTVFEPIPQHQCLQHARHRSPGDGSVGSRAATLTAVSQQHALTAAQQAYALCSPGLWPQQSASIT